MGARSGTIARAWLLLYNASCAAGWAWCLFQTLSTWSRGPAAVVQAAGPAVELFQGLSILEVLHAAIGIVPSSPFMAFTQWAGRSHALSVLVLSPSLSSSTVFGPVMLLCWAISEVIRYPWYALSIIERCPAALTWLRYSAFIPLYPVGVVAEMAIMYQALPELERTRRWTVTMPNPYNFSFEYHVFVRALLVVYLLPWFMLYSSLVRTRRRKLGAAAQGTKGLKQQ